MADLLIPQLEAGSLKQYRMLKNAQLVAAIQAELGSTATLIPLFDTQWDFGATSFTSIQSHSDGIEDTFTYSAAPNTWATVPSYEGIVPILTFDGASNEADGSADTYWSRVGGDMTIIACVNMATAASSSIFSKWDATTATPLREYDFNINSDSELSFIAHDESVDDSDFGMKDDTAIVAAQWHQVAVTYDFSAVGGGEDGTIDLYIDTVESSVDTSSGAGAFVAMEDTATVVAVGYRVIANGSKTNFFNGSMAGGGCGIWVVQAKVTPEQLINVNRLQKAALGKI